MPPSGASFGNSFSEQSLQRSNSNANYYGMGASPDSLRHSSSHVNPLAHAHKVNRNGAEASPASKNQGSGVQNFGNPAPAASYGAPVARPNYYGAPMGAPGMAYRR